MATKKDQLLDKSRALVGGRKITSLSDFQETPTEGVLPEKITIDDNTSVEHVRTMTHTDTQRRTKVATKVVRENFRFTEKLAAALERYATEKRLKKNTVIEIALEQHLKQEGYL